MMAALVRTFQGQIMASLRPAGPLQK